MKPSSSKLTSSSRRITGSSSTTSTVGAGIGACYAPTCGAPKRLPRPQRAMSRATRTRPASTSSSDPIQIGWDEPVSGKLCRRESCWIGRRRAIVRRGRLGNRIAVVGWGRRGGGRAGIAAEPLGQGEAGSAASAVIGEGAQLVGGVVADERTQRLDERRAVGRLVADPEVAEDPGRRCRCGASYQ